MFTLNHLNLPTSDVPGLLRFFQMGFGFNVQHEAGQKNGGPALVVLTDEAGFILTLMHDKNGSPNSYPGIFHCGFSLKTADEVRHYYQRLVDAGFTVPEPNLLSRGGPPAYGFYAAAPGNVTVEVSTFAA